MILLAFLCPHHISAPLRGLLLEERVMRSLIGVVGATLLFSAAHAGTVSVGPSPDRPFSFNFGSGARVFGPVIFDGYRSLDGKNFYLDDSSPGMNEGKILPGLFDAGPAGSSAESSSKPFTASLADFARNGGGVGAFAAAPGSVGSSQGGSGGSLAGGTKSSFFLQAALEGNRSGEAGNGLPLLAGGKGDPGPSNVSATPLPPAWTLLLLGLGCFGMIASRRQPKLSGRAKPCAGSL
jgi:hypothetical protein